MTGWQTVTGGVFANNQVIKVSNGFYIPDVTPTSAHVPDVIIGNGTAGMLGNQSKITSEFINTGLSGFGTGDLCSPLSSVCIWTGKIDTDWTKPGNWACGVVPVSTSDVEINGGLTNYPILATDVTIKSLLVKPGATYTVVTGKTLTITGL